MSLSKSIRKFYSNRIWLQGTFSNLPFGRSLIELSLSLRLGSLSTANLLETVLKGEIKDAVVYSKHVYYARL